MKDTIKKILLDSVSLATAMIVTFVLLVWLGVIEKPHLKDTHQQSVAVSTNGCYLVIYSAHRTNGSSAIGNMSLCTESNSITAGFVFAAIAEIGRMRKDLDEDSVVLLNIIPLNQ